MTFVQKIHTFNVDEIDGRALYPLIIERDKQQNWDRNDLVENVEFKDS